MKRNCLFCGVGGQGVVLVSKLTANAAMHQGLFVRTTETIGMAQRGGSVVSHVRMGHDLHSPLIPEASADLILALEPAEAVRNLRFLKPGATVITNTKALKPVTATLTGVDYDGPKMISYLQQQVSNLIVVDGEELCRQAGSAKVLNVALLGAAAAVGALGLSPKELEEELIRQMNPRYLELNQKALQLGALAAGKQEKQRRPGFAGTGEQTC